MKPNNRCWRSDSLVSLQLLKTKRTNWSNNITRTCELYGAAAGSSERHRDLGATRSSETLLTAYFHSSSAQEKQVKELRRLICTKANIEQEMATITGELQAACIKSTSILRVVLDGRVDEYEEALKQLDNLATGKVDTQMEMSQEL